MADQVVRDDRERLVLILKDIEDGVEPLWREWAWFQKMCREKTEWVIMIMNEVKRAREA